MLIVEDGTIVADANSYIEREWADDYFASRKSEQWAALNDAEREAAIIKATDYLDFAYEWEGLPTSDDQLLSWPRRGVLNKEHQIIPSDLIPYAIKRATAELAVRASQGPLMDDQSRGGAVLEETVGPISVKYEQGAVSGVVYRSIDKILTGLYIGRGFFMRSERL